MDPNIGYAAAAHYALSPATLVLGSVQVVFWLAVRGRTRTTAALRAIDVTGNALIGVTFGIIAFRHPEPGISVFEGLLALNLVLGARAVLVPSSARRTALVGALAVLGPVAVMVMYSSHFALPQVGAPTLVSMFAMWAIVGVALSTVASSVLYGLRREVQAARQLGQYTLARSSARAAWARSTAPSHAHAAPADRDQAAAPRPPRRDGLARFEREVQLTARPHPSEHGRDLRLRPHARRRLLLRDGVPRRHRPRAAGRAIDGPQPAARVIHILRQVCGVAVRGARARA